MIKYLTFFILLFSSQAFPQRARVQLIAARFQYGLLSYEDAFDAFRGLQTTKYKSEADFFLGRMYNQGEGVEVRPDVAVRFFRSGIAGNNKLCWYGLGVCFELGEGLEKNLDSAKMCYQKAISEIEKRMLEGEPFSGYLFGLCLFNGRGVEPDKARAKALMHKASSSFVLQADFWLASQFQKGSFGAHKTDSAILLWKKLATQQHLPSIRNLANVYLTGNGVPKDTSEGRAYLEQAFKRKDFVSGLQLAELLKHIKGEDQNRFRLLKILSNEGHFPAYLPLADAFLTGFGTAKQTDSALFYYQRAAEKQNAEAMYSLGFLYYDGQFVEKDWEKAQGWFTKGALLEHAACMYQLGYMKENGQVGPVNYCDAVLWYEKASKMNHPLALFRLGLCNMYQNRCAYGGATSAIGLFERSANLGEASAAINLGLMYINGLQVPIDLSLGVYWLQKGLQLSPNSSVALFNLGKTGLQFTEAQISKEMAIAYLEKAGAAGHPDAYYYLANAFFEGLYVPKNFKTALAYLLQMPADVKTEKLLGELYVKGDATMPAQATKAFIYFYRSYILGNATDKSLEAQLKKTGKTLSMAQVKALLELSSEKGGFAMPKAEADSLCKQLLKDGWIGKK